MTDPDEVRERRRRVRDSVEAASDDDIIPF